MTIKIIHRSSYILYDIVNITNKRSLLHIHISSTASSFIIIYSSMDRSGKCIFVILIAVLPMGMGMSPHWRIKLWVRSQCALGEQSCWAGQALSFVPPTSGWLECVLGGEVITVLMVTAKRDQKAYVNALTDNKNTYYSLVLDTSYLKNLHLQCYFWIKILS